jgi:hypothetical protein
MAIAEGTANQAQHRTDLACRGRHDRLHTGAVMNMGKTILDLLKDEGYRINEAIEDAIDEFVSLVEEENEKLDDDLAEGDRTKEEE